MITFIEISKEELPEVIKISYIGDDELLEKYHLQKFTLEQAINKELELIENMSKQIKLKYFKVLMADKTMGYIVRSGSFLYSFAVSIFYRSKFVLKEWWKGLCNEMGEKFKTAFMSNNTRAIEYFKKRGFGIIKELEGEILLSNY